MNYNNELLIDYASKKTRFVNFLLDKVFFWILHIIIVFSFGDWIHALLGKSFLYNFSYFLLVYFLYYFIFELAFSRTPGKFLTGTKVVDENDRKPSLKALVIRNACRLIPFDGLSFLIAERGWHDSISKTEVLNT